MLRLPLLQGNSQPRCCGPLLVTNGLKLQDGMFLSGGLSALLNPGPSILIQKCHPYTGNL